MRADRVVLCWYSGTGNTELAAARLAEGLRDSGIAVESCRIGRDPLPLLPADAALGLAFPVAYLSTYPFVWDFLDRLPPGAGREVFMMDTLGGGSGAIVGPLRRRLAGKGYLPVGAREIRMPVNFGRTVGNRERNRHVLESGLERVARYASDLADGKARWRRVFLLPDLVFLLHAAMVSLLFTRWNQQRFGMWVDPGSCSGCGVCVTECPVGNIRMVQDLLGEGGMPAFDVRCEFCLRCLATCPREAIRSPLCPAGSYRAADIAGGRSGELPRKEVGDVV